ncbi:MAG: hypothetical protein SGPRY_007366 [Prymnesium sp.]
MTPPSQPPSATPSRRRVKATHSAKQPGPLALRLAAEGAGERGLDAEWPEGIASAAKQFDERYLCLCAEAQSLLRKVGRATTNPSRVEQDFNRALDEMRRNRRAPA